MIKTHADIDVGVVHVVHVSGNAMKLRKTKSSRPVINTICVVKTQERRERHSNGDAERIRQSRDFDSRGRRGAAPPASSVVTTTHWRQADPY